ncbi:MAG TPA: hypothetical protein VHB25_18785, partial [Gemmatimonadaceae bacterium]|nr:hypothetical protein [Gemmatimonadaceae bacterium]
MGLIHLPRAYFNGFTYWDPSTMNNNDYQPVYDPANARLNWPWLQRHGFETAQQYDQYATTPTVGTPNEGANVNYVSGIPPAEWNYYGGNNCGFVNPAAPAIEQPQNFGKPPGTLAITGFTNPGGTLVTSGDPWIGLPLQLNLGLPPAKLVDVDPVCPWSSQIFCDTINLAAPGDASGLVGQTAGRAHSRWVFFLRNVNLNGDVLIAGVGSAAFQLGIRTGQLQIFDQQPASGSLASDLIDVLVQPGVKGLMVRFVTYLTVYFQGPAFPAPHTTATCWPQITQLYAEYLEQRQQYESGQLASPPPPPVNRAYSKTVGWIAPWFDGELHSAPGGRMLAPAGPATALQPTLPKPTLIGPAVVEAAASPTNPAAVGRIAIDLGSTMPEYDATATKIDFGTFNIGLAPLNNPRAPATTISSIPYAGGYDTPTYTLTSGVVDIPAS